MDKKFDLQKFLTTNALPIKNPHNLSIAPMVDVTDSYFRTFLRFFTKNSMLYSEMIHTKTVLDPKNRKKLIINPVEKPITLQIGGSDPEELALASKIGEKHGYDEINLNCGCPSSKVQCGAFGACLMKNPKLVGECLKRMKESVSIPVSCKCRLGVDDFDSFEFFEEFVDVVYEISKVDLFIVHARKAFLKGLSTKDNRIVPPLLYDFVYRIAKKKPHLRFVLNGGLRTKEDIMNIKEEDRNLLTGFMIGRSAYQNVWLINGFDELIYGKKLDFKCREQIMIDYSLYADWALERDPKLNRNTVIKPMISLFTGKNGNKFFKSYFSNSKNVKKFDKFSDVVLEFLRVFKEKEFSKINPQILYCMKL